MFVPAALAGFLRDPVFGICPPALDVLHVLPVRNGDAEAIIAAHAFYAQLAGLLGGKHEHPVGHLAITLFNRRALR